MELLERVVGKHGPVDLLGHAQQERVPAPDRARGGMHVLAAQRGLLETSELGGIDAVGEGGVHDDGDLRVRVITPQLGHGLLELDETRKGAALCRDVRPVDDYVLDWHVLVVKHPGPVTTGNSAHRPL